MTLACRVFGLSAEEKGDVVGWSAVACWSVGRKEFMRSVSRMVGLVAEEKVHVISWPDGWFVGRREG